MTLEQKMNQIEDSYYNDSIYLEEQDYFYNLCPESFDPPEKQIEKMWEKRIKEKQDQLLTNRKSCI